MTNEEYLKDIRRTFDPQRKELSLREYLCSTAMGLLGEAGEVSELVKKHLFHNRRNIRQELIEELGDTLAYLIAHADAWGISVEELMETNTAKRLKKYPKKHGAKISDQVEWSGSFK